jgi:two-component system, NtrC family, response regulator AtoC
MDPMRVLLVDDDPEIHDFVAVALADEPVELTGVGSAEEALARLGGSDPDLILLDLVLPGMDGCTALRELRDRGVDTPVVLITSHGSLDAAIRAVEAGALDVVSKPLRVAPLLELVARVRTMASPGPDDDGADRPVASHDAVLIGRSPRMVEVYKAVARVARTDSTVLIQGESGTGKELVAQALHRYSRRAGSFVAMNCAAVPETLLEAELFGHERGAFTGATSSKPGKLEHAAHGTFLLDEVGDMPLPLQAKILRVLDQRRFERIGGNRSIDVDVRMIGATHHDLRERVKAGQFRADLFYRLAVVTITLPPLRERKEDIPLLVDHFVARLGPRVGRVITTVQPEVYEQLESHSWPGNVRELRNVLEQSLILGRGPVLERSSLPELGVPLQADALYDRLASHDKSLADVERGYIQRVLQVTDWNQSAAARRLGIHRNTLHRKIRSYRLMDDDRERRVAGPGEPSLPDRDS